MSNQLLRQFTEKYCKSSVPDLRPGYRVRVHQKIQEGAKTRVQVFEGMIIAVNAGHGVEDTFTVRKVTEGIGAEKVFPIHSPNIVKIEVTRAHKVRRSKLNFLRNLSGKALRLKEVPFDLKHKTFESVSQEEELPADVEGEESALDETVVEDVKEDTEEKKEVETPVVEEAKEELKDEKEEVKEEK